MELFTEFLALNRSHVAISKGLETYLCRFLRILPILIRISQR
jgi:hypothetical protein